MIKRLRNVSTAVEVKYLLLGGFPVEGILAISIPCTRHMNRISIYTTYHREIESNFVGFFEIFGKLLVVSLLGICSCKTRN